MTIIKLFYSILSSPASCEPAPEVGEPDKSEPAPATEPDETEPAATLSLFNLFWIVVFIIAMIGSLVKSSKIMPIIANMQTAITKGTPWAIKRLKFSNGFSKIGRKYQTGIDAINERRQSFNV